jgi:predicted secreted protein
MSHAGNGGVLEISADNVTYSEVAELTSWSIEESGEAIETTSMGSDRFKTFIQGNYGWSGSGEANWSDDDTAQEAIETALISGDSTFYGKFFPIGTSAGDYWSGLIVVTGVSFSGSVDAPISFSFSFQGTGALTHTNA